MPQLDLISANERNKVREGKSSIDYHDEYEHTLAEACRLLIEAISGEDVGWYTAQEIKEFLAHVDGDKP